MNFWVADPHWGVWVIAYFFLGGIAAGSYFLAILIEWFGSADDRPLARIAYWIAFPLIVVCGVLLIVDLYRPERFWHMLLKSEITKAAFAEGFPFSIAGWRRAFQAPAFKYWSPMSVGSWGLTLFGLASFLSFLATVWPRRAPGRWLLLRWPYRILQLLGCAAGFFVASYTGTLLSATSQPVWSDTTWLASLFLASAASTSAALMILVARWKRVGSVAARSRLAAVEPVMLVIELVVLGLFLLSLGEGLRALLLTWRGLLLVVGVVTFGVLAPLLLHTLIGHQRTWTIPTAAVLVLAGGLLLRYTVLAVPGEILDRGPGILAHFSPENQRMRGGGAGGDFQNYTERLTPRTKLPVEP